MEVIMAMTSAAARRTIPGVVTNARRKPARPDLPNPFELNRRINASDLPGTAKRLAISIYDHARYGASTCTAADETLSKDLGGDVGPRQVFRLRELLEAEGWTQTDRLGASKFARKIIGLGPRCYLIPT